MSDFLGRLYRERFSPRDTRRKNELWKVLCGCFFQKYVPKESAAVLDIGAGYCEFINNIKAQKKIAIDLIEDFKLYANSDVETHCCSATDLGFLPDDSINIIFISNFLEHLDSKEMVLRILSEVFRICKRGGAVLILQPNIRYAYKEYWDFFDHRIPLSDRSVREALTTVGFRVDMVYPKFLPYSTKSTLPQWSWLVKLYLKIPPAWNVVGKQAFIVGVKV